MSTTFAVDTRVGHINVARRCNGIRWVDPLAELLPDDTPVKAIDNTPQGVYTIGDIRKEINKEYHITERVWQYWYIDTIGDVTNQVDNDTFTDRRRYEIGNYFTNEEDAKVMAANVKRVLRREL